MYNYGITWKVTMCMCSIQSYELNVLTKCTKYTIEMAEKKTFLGTGHYIHMLMMFPYF